MKFQVLEERLYLKNKDQNWDQENQQQLLILINNEKHFQEIKVYSPINLNNLHSSKKDYWQIESYYQADFEGEESERIKTEKLNQNIYEQSLKNCLTEDKEIEDGSQQSDIDWCLIKFKYLQEQLLKEILKVVQEPKQPLPLAVKPILNKEKVMMLVWVNLPSIYMNNLRNFGLSENSEYPQQSENKEEGKEIMLIKVHLVMLVKTKIMVKNF